MYIFTLVGDVYKSIEKLRLQRGEYKLAMLFNTQLDLSSNWNLIVSADWTDRLGIAESTKAIVEAIYEDLQLENRPALSRVTVLKTTDPFVRDMVQFMGSLYPILPRQGGVPVSQITAGGIEGAGFVFYSQPAVPA